MKKFYAGEGQPILLHSGNHKIDKNFMLSGINQR